MAVVAIFLTTWGGISARRAAIIVAWLISSLFGMTLLGIGQTLLIWMIAVVVDAIFDPIVNVSMDPSYRQKCRLTCRDVFSASDFISQAMPPHPFAGWLPDRIRAGDGHGRHTRERVRLAGRDGTRLRFGPDLAVCSLGGTLIGLAGYLIPSIRRIDTLMPDFQRLPPIGMIKRMPALRTRKSTRKTRKSIHKRVRVRTHQPPKE